MIGTRSLAASPAALSRVPSPPITQQASWPFRYPGATGNLSVSFVVTPSRAATPASAAATSEAPAFDEFTTNANFLIGGMGGRAGAQGSTFNSQYSSAVD